jgi:uncharacterized protein YggE
MNNQPEPPWNQPDTITISSVHSDDVSASQVDLHLSVKGSSLFTGNASFRKAKEVAQLVANLDHAGIKAEDISLAGIHVESSGGLLGRSTAASYRLKLHCKNLEALADVLGVISDQKNVSLDCMVWKYPEEGQTRAEWLDLSLRQARQKAARVADALGVRILGVHDLIEQWTDEEAATRAHRPASAEVAFALAAKSRAVDLGFTLTHSKRLALEVTIRFRVGDYTSKGATGQSEAPVG